jgi:hypothetical protein
MAFAILGLKQLRSFELQRLATKFKGRGWEIECINEGPWRHPILLRGNMLDNDSDKSKVSRDPEDRPAANEHELREKMLDKTLADSFPTSDPPSTIPDPAGEDSLRLNDVDFQNESGENADQRNNPGAQDRSRISLSDHQEIRRWTESLGVSREHLEELIHKHGDSAEKIREVLKKDAA